MSQAQLTDKSPNKFAFSDIQQNLNMLLKFIKQKGQRQLYLIFWWCQNTATFLPVSRPLTHFFYIKEQRD